MCTTKSYKSDFEVLSKIIVVFYLLYWKNKTVSSSHLTKITWLNFGGAKIQNK